MSSWFFRRFFSKILISEEPNGPYTSKNYLQIAQRLLYKIFKKKYGSKLFRTITHLYANIAVTKMAKMPVWEVPVRGQKSLDRPKITFFRSAR